MNPLLGVGREVFPGIYRLEKYALRTLADTEHCHRFQYLVSVLRDDTLVLLLKEGPKSVSVQVAFHQAVEAEFHRLQRHALKRNAEVNVDVSFLRKDAVNDDERTRRLFPHRFAEKNLPQCIDLVNIGRIDRPESEKLAVHRAGERRIDIDDSVQLLSAYVNVLSETADRAVLDQQRVQRRIGALDDAFPCS